MCKERSSEKCTKAVIYTIHEEIYQSSFMSIFHNAICAQVKPEGGLTIKYPAVQSIDVS